MVYSVLACSRRLDLIPPFAPATQRLPNQRLAPEEPIRSDWRGGIGEGRHTVLLLLLVVVSIVAHLQVFGHRQISTGLTIDLPPHNDILALTDLLLGTGISRSESSLFVGLFLGFMKCVYLLLDELHVI